MRHAEDVEPPRFPGLYLAQVETVEDQGYLQVSVPSIADQAKPDLFVWARPCFPYGHFFMPEKGDKVWLAFENGDPTAPVWLGVWYPQGKVPQEAQASPPVKRVIRSAKGHLVILDDTDGSEQLVLQDKGGNRIELRGDGVLIKCVQDLTIDASGKNVVIKASSVDVQKA
jgi:hypothetical protein